MRRLPLLILLALAACAAAGAHPGAASAARGMEVALQDDGVFVHRSWFDRESALKKARALGVTRLRVNVLWSRVAAGSELRRPPAVRTYDFSAFDSLIDDAARHGIRLQMTLTGPAPRWATADKRIGMVRPDAYAFTNFARDVARHFAGRVDRYSIWNEPNWHTWLTPARGCRHGRWASRCDRLVASLYRTLYRRSAEAIRDEDPRAEVLFGELAPQGRPGSATPPLQFLRDVTCSRRDWTAAKRCSELEADGFAHHPYAFTTRPELPYGGPDDVVIGTLGRLTKALDKLAKRRALRTPRGRRLDLYLTEHGYFSAGRRRIPAARRAAWLSQSFDVALRHPRVRQMLQYLLVAPPRARDTFPTHVMTRGGRPTRAYRALQRWSKRHRRRIAKAAAPRPVATPAPQPAEPAPAPPPAR